MDNLKLRVWEVSSGEVKRFVLADSMATMKQYFYIGSGGFIRERPDMQVDDIMETLTPKPLPPQKASDFTKLELASLMIAASLVHPDDWKLGEATTKDDVAAKIAQTSTMVAKAVLEEANK